MTQNGMRPIHPGEILREEFLSPLGMSALAYSLTAFGIGSLVDSGVRAEGVLAVGYCALGSAAGVTLFAVVGGLTGQPNVWTDDVARVIVVSSLFNTLLAPLALVALRWAEADSDARSGTGVRMVN